jgi:PKD repeat protein
MTPEEMNRVTDRTSTSSLFDLFNRVYRGGKDVSIQAQTEGTGMMSSKTVAEHTYDKVNATNQVPGWTGSTVYALDLMTNGGNVDETRTLTADTQTQSQRLITYHANGSTSMQTQERLVATKEVFSTTNSSSDPRCIFIGDGGNNTTTASYQSISASSQLMGVDSAQSVSQATLDIGSKNNGSSPLVADYHVDITSPVQFDPTLLQTMSDQDNDGRYEDLNGNHHQDIQDLVLLFKNFEWLSKSSISPRFDYNANGRVDFADLTHAFANITRK